MDKTETTQLLSAIMSFMFATDNHNHLCNISIQSGHRSHLTMHRTNGLSG